MKLKKLEKDLLVEINRIIENKVNNKMFGVSEHKYKEAIESLKLNLEIEKHHEKESIDNKDYFKISEIEAEGYLRGIEFCINQLNYLIKNIEK